MTELPSLKFPWPFALLLVVPLSLPITQALRDLRSGHLSADARAQQAQLELDRALISLRQATQSNPGDAKIQVQLGQSLRTLWFYRRQPSLKRDAETAFASAERLNPNWATPYYEHALLYAFVEDYPRALTLLQGALQRDPNNAGYWLQRARYLTRSGQQQAAANAYRQCWAIDTVPECQQALRKLERQP